MSHPRKTSTSTVAAAVWPLVVGTVYSAESLRAAEALAGVAGGPDLLELRVDHFAGCPEALDGLTAAAARLFIVTVRHGAEGGAGELSDGKRAELFERFRRCARLLDVEVRSLAVHQEAIRAARAGGCGVIASFHDFSGMPDLQELRCQADHALEAGAHLLKVAAMTRTPADLAVLLEFLAVEDRLPLALMGMGPLGRVSRLTLAAAGSVLNYGYLGETSQVSGQWPAALLRNRLDELLSDRAPQDVECSIAGIMNAGRRQ